MTVASTRSDRIPRGRAGLRGAVRSEWTKLWSVRSTGWSLVAMSTISVGLMSVIAWTAVRQWKDLEAEEQASLAGQPLEIILSRPIYIAQLVVAVLGVMAVTADYTTGMIRPTLQAQPRRLTVLTAKVLVLAAIMLAVGELLSFLAFAVGKPIIAERIPVRLGADGILRAVIGAGLYLTLLSLFSLAVGTVIRHTAGAITTVLGLVLVISGLTGLLPGTWGARVNAWMPTNAGQLILQSQPDPDAVLTPWQGLAVFTGWTTLLLALGAILLVHRDA